MFCRTAIHKGEINMDKEMLDQVGRVYLWASTMFVVVILAIMFVMFK